MSRTATFLLFLALLAGVAGFALLMVEADIANANLQLRWATTALLACALVTALAFEFVNGFHDTANAVATVIYTHSLSPTLAVVWSGVFNFLGVLTSSGAVAFAIVKLLPIELVLHGGGPMAFAMIFALLISALGWNLATWAAGIPNSSSHALIGSVLGVGLAHQLLGSGPASRLDWGQATGVVQALLFSPLVGFVGAWLLFHLIERSLRSDGIRPRSGVSGRPPSRGIRALLIATCSAVSFAHGSNDGQKGMGLIMLILIGCAPAAYALGGAQSQGSLNSFGAGARSAQAVFDRLATMAPRPDPASARTQVAAALEVDRVDRPATFAALSALSGEIANAAQQPGSFAAVPPRNAIAIRSDMYLVERSIDRLGKAGSALKGDAGAAAILKSHARQLKSVTQIVPTWVKVAAALALGLGTMVGWRRIVETVGERVGRERMTPAMGATAEVVAAGTILLASRWGLPVSTTHILTAGVAGSAVADRMGVRMRTIRGMALAWVLTLPVSMALAGFLYLGFTWLLR